MSSSQFKIVLVMQVVTLFLVGMLFFKTPIPEIGKPLSSPDTKYGSGKSNVKIEYGSNYVFGNPEAQNELIVFSRYNCGFCRDFYNETFDSLKTKYVQTGKLRIVFMDNVNPSDKLAMMMATVAEIGKQLNVYEAIQTQLYKGNQPKDSLEIVNRALNAGINEEQLIALLGKPEIRETVLEDNQIVDRLQLTGTPTFVINGNTVVGFKGYKEFMTNLEELLNK